MPTAAIATFSGHRLDPCRNPKNVMVRAVNLKASTTYLAGTVLGRIGSVNAIQTLTGTGTISGGTWGLTAPTGEKIANTALAFNATAAQIVAALVALPGVGPGGVTATGGPISTTPVVLTFTGLEGLQPLTLMVVDGTLLTGAGATITPTTTTAGVGTPGTYGPYASGNSDGTQTPIGFCQYDCVTDASGNIVFGTGPAGTSEWGQTRKDAPMHTMGLFRCEDLVGFDATALAAMGRLISGNIVNGEVQIR